MRKISSEQKADIVRRIQVKNPDGTWAVTYKDIAAEFGVSRCLISHIAKHAGLPRRERGPQAIPFVGKRYHPPAQLWDMYQQLRDKVGMMEARRLIEDHMRIRGVSYEHVCSGSSVDVEPIAA
jgi:AraC-like DNA-binding protein